LPRRGFGAIDRGYPAALPRRASHSAASRAGAVRRQGSSANRHE